MLNRCVSCRLGSRKAQELQFTVLETLEVGFDDRLDFAQLVCAHVSSKGKDGVCEREGLMHLVRRMFSKMSK